MSSNIFKSNDLFQLWIFGLDIPVSNSILMMWIIIVILIVGSIIFTRNLQTIPKGRQNAAEAVVEFINNFIKENIGRHWKSYAPYFGSLFLFLIFANASDLFTMTFGKFEIVAPTMDLNLTLSFAIMTVLIVLFSGIHYKGFGGWLKSFLKPLPIMLPFNIMDYGTRTLSLSLRLYGNIIAGYVILKMLYDGAAYVKPLIPLASVFFDIFDAFLQAYIFVFLSTIYVSEAVEQGGEHE